MSKTLTLRNVPDRVLRGLRRRARENGRSVQRELLEIVEMAVMDESSALAQLGAARARLSKPLTAEEIHAARNEGRA